MYIKIIFAVLVYKPNYGSYKFAVRRAAGHFHNHSVQSHLSNIFGSIHVVRVWQYWLRLRPLLSIQVLHTSLVEGLG